MRKALTRLSIPRRGTLLVRFGVVTSDWKFVLAATLIGYTVPFWLDLKLWRVPLELWSGLVAAATSVAFFNYVRIGRRPYWLQHHTRAIIEHSCHRRALPADHAKQPRRQWMIVK